jgi:phenylalanyl-tRNA synthetase beta chain
MKVLLSWLKEFVEVPVEPARLAADLTLVGLAVDAVEARGSDTLLDLDITTNRVDCMNVYGVAREVSVRYGVPLRAPETSFAESGPAGSSALAVAILAPDLCRRFSARVFDVSVAPSPAWLRERLEALGVRSINNVVDVTNYVMLEMGQPTHAFDLALVPGARLEARWARDGETLKTLDGEERTLASGQGLVASGASPLALAGIMGGAASEVSDATRAIAVEAACWQPLAIRRAARALGLHTEASHRFERGADPEAPPLAIARIAHLLQQIGAGTTRPGLLDARTAATDARPIAFRPGRLRVVLGVDVPEPEWRRILGGLGFGVADNLGDGVALTVPSWRGDVRREIDAVEEIARHHGLERIAPTIPAASIPGGLQSWQRRERTLAEALVGAGLSEVIRYAFVSEAEAGIAPGERVALENPLSEDQAVLRNSLVVPGLLDALRGNLRKGRRDVRLFEIGRVFMAGEERPAEELRLGIILAGAARAGHWSEKARLVDFFDAKGLVERALRGLGVRGLEWRTPVPASFLHPGRAAAVVRAEEVLGYVGSVHPEVAAAFELRDGAVVAEIRVEGLLREEPGVVRVRPLPRFPAVARDLSVLASPGATAERIRSVVRDGAGRLLRSVLVTDRFEGPPVPDGKVSLTLSLVFQHPERTLTGEEVQEAVDRAVEILRSIGAEIRGD